MIIIAFFVFLRLAHLEADFPTGITWSGAVYTDEGWYCKNAVAQVAYGDWYIEGDSNLAVHFPVFILLQVFFFKIFGVSFFSARLVIVFSFILMLIFLFGFLNKLANQRVAYLGSFLISINYFIFAYSRLAIGEIPMLMFIMLSFLFIAANPAKNKLIFLTASAIALFASVLVKSTGLIYALPVSVFLIWKQKTANRRKILDVSIFTITLMFCFALLYILFLRRYWGDFTQFYSHNFSVRFDSDQSIFLCILKAFFNGYRIDYVLYPISIIGGLFLFGTRENFRKDKLFTMSLLWIFLNCLMLGINRYYPPRYFIPTAIPVIIIVSIITDYVFENFRKSFFNVLMVCLLIASSAFNIVEIARYISSPRYSLIGMCNDIKNLCASEESGEPVLIGTIANTVSIGTGIFSVNDDPELFDLKLRIEIYEPDFYISVGKIDPAVENILKANHKISLIKTYDILNNYLNGEPVYFYRLDSRLFNESPQI